MTVAEDLQHSLFILTEKRKVGQALHPDAEETRFVIAAARERLRLSRIPCETCGGKGRIGAEIGGQWGIDDCPACNGSGELWPAELVEVVGGVPYTEEWERAVLDALDLWAKEATK